MLPNVLQYPVVMCGALRAGLTVVNTNPLYTETELEYQLRDSGATALVVLENFASIAAAGVADDFGAPRHRDGRRRSAAVSEGRARQLRAALRAAQGSCLEAARRHIP